MTLKICLGIRNQRQMQDRHISSTCQSSATHWSSCPRSSYPLYLAQSETPCSPLFSQGSQTSQVLNYLLQLPNISKSFVKRVSELTMIAQKHRSRSSAFPLRNFNDRFRFEHRTSRASKWAVSGDKNTLLLAEVHNFLLWQGWVVLNLVDSWNNRAVG